MGFLPFFLSIFPYLGERDTKIGTCPSPSRIPRNSVPEILTFTSIIVMRRMKIRIFIWVFFFFFPLLRWTVCRNRWVYFSAFQQIWAVYGILVLFFDIKGGKKIDYNNFDFSFSCFPLFRKTRSKNWWVSDFFPRRELWVLIKWKCLWWKSPPFFFFLIISFQMNSPQSSVSRFDGGKERGESVFLFYIYSF